MNEIIMMHSRRRFISYIPLLVAGGFVYPSIVFGNTKNDSPDYRAIRYIMRLHPVRFVAGLIFDVIESVLSDFVSSTILSKLINNPSSSFKNIKVGSTEGFERAADFKHPNYKASNVILGVSNYENHKKRVLKVLLKNTEQEKKFNDLLYYLRSEKIRIKTSETEYSFPLGAYTEPDDLFMIDYLQIDKNHEEHYKEIIDISGSKIFKYWSI